MFAGNHAPQNQTPSNLTPALLGPDLTPAILYDNPATGPKTDEGKRIAARNATTHGLFSRDVVLPHLGEDPAGYEALLQEMTKQLHPKNLLEQHYVEKIAAASWRLRRLQRWQGQLFEDPSLTEEQAIKHLDSVLRHETALHRQIDQSVKMLARELPKLFEEKVRADLIQSLNGTEQECRQDPGMNDWVRSETKKRLPASPVPADFDRGLLDTAPADAAFCQNEPPPPAPPAVQAAVVYADSPGMVYSDTERETDRLFAQRVEEMRQRGQGYRGISDYAVMLSERTVGPGKHRNR